MIPFPRLSLRTSGFMNSTKTNTEIFDPDENPKIPDRTHKAGGLLNPPALLHFPRKFARF